MDQEKIGKFIASCRKEKGLTQAVLAEELGITNRAVSKWETGRSLPDASIMQELCELLGITVSELFCGERLEQDDNKKKIDELLIEMKQQEETANRRLLKLEKFLIVTIIPVVVLMIVSGAIIMEKMMPLGIVLMVSGFALMIACCVVGLNIEHKAGYYECPKCGEKYVPTFKSVFFAPHIGTTRRMKCPYCGEKGYHKKVLTR